MADARMLTELGLTAYEASAYLCLLGRSELTPAEVAARAGIPRQRVYDVLGTLTAKGLCLARDAGGPRTFSAVDPAKGLELLARERGEALMRQREETLSLAGRLAEELGPVFASGRGQNDPLAYVEVLAGAGRIAARAQELARGAKTRVNSCIAPPMILSVEQNRTFMEAPLGRGLAYRALCDAAILEDADLATALGDCCRAGLDLRIVPSLPLKMQAFDDEVALLSMQDPAGGPPSFTAVVIRNRGVVAMLGLAFEQLWAGAEPYREDKA